MARILLSPIARDNPAENKAIPDIKRSITTSISPLSNRQAPTLASRSITIIDKACSIPSYDVNALPIYRDIISMPIFCIKNSNQCI